MVGQRGLPSGLVATAFLLPSLLGLLLVRVFPMIAALGIGFTDWQLISPPRWVGLANYIDLFSRPEFWQALLHTLTYIAGYVPTVMTLGFVAALAMNVPRRGLSVHRVAFFAPVVSSWVAVSIIWKWLLNPVYGPVNQFIGWLGLCQPGWMLDPSWAMPSVIIASVWKDIGFVMVLYLAGLQNINPELLEAAEIDGANRWARLRRIVIPLLSPTTFMVVALLLINSFQVFEQVWIMTEGGPGGATTVLVERIYRHAFRYFRMGTASAYSWVLFAIVLAVTILQLKLQKRWVFYQ